MIPLMFTVSGAAWFYCVSTFCTQMLPLLYMVSGAVWFSVCAPGGAHTEVACVHTVVCTVHTVMRTQWCAHSGAHTEVCTQWCAHRGVHTEVACVYTVVCTQWCAHSGVNTEVCTQCGFLCVHLAVCGGCRAGGGRARNKRR